MWSKTGSPRTHTKYLYGTCGPSITLMFNLPLTFAERERASQVVITARKEATVFVIDFLSCFDFSIKQLSAKERRVVLAGTLFHCFGLTQLEP